MSNSSSSRRPRLELTVPGRTDGGGTTVDAGLDTPELPGKASSIKSGIGQGQKDAGMPLILRRSRMIG